MIIGNDRKAVIHNIREAASAADFHRKVENNDPVLTAQESKRITDRFLLERHTAGFALRSFAARRLADIGTAVLNRSTTIIGEELLPDLSNGAIITSNHFGPLENTVIRHLVRRHGQKRLNIVSQVTNFAMTGIIGFLMNYADTIPLSGDRHYLAKDFPDLLREALDRHEVVLIYPEQEMWFNYRKPRPLKRGAYYFAAKLNAPIVSCFVEILDRDEKDTDDFYKVSYRLHILGTLYPDSSQCTKVCSEELCQRDFALKKAAYERAYGKPLDYRFENGDIAGWVKGYE